MSALKGPIAVRRYAVRDALPEKMRERFTKGVRAHSFMSIDPAGDLSTSSGWVSILDGDDADLTQQKLFFVASGGEQLRVTLRTDTLKPPAADVRRIAAARCAEKEASEGRSLSRREKREVKDEVVRHLRQRVLPRRRLADVVWNLDGGRVWLWSQSKAVNELFVDLFAKSFGVRLDVENAAAWAGEVLDERAQAALTPTMELFTGFVGVRPLGSAVADDADAG